MSPSPSQIDIKPFDVAALESQQHEAADAADNPLISPTSATIHAFGLDSTDGTMNGASPNHTMLDAPQFGDLSFSYQGLQEGSSIVSLGEPKFDSNEADAYSSPHRPSVASAADRADSIADFSMAGTSFGGAGAGQRRSSLNPSDEGSQDRNSPGANSLEDSVADEFGLSSTGFGDRLDHDGKVKDEKGDTAPPWSELKTKAGKERKRLPLACIACRRKKIRCSGEKPACKHCLRSRIPCVYKVTTRKAAPRTDYMAMLDKRLKRMEERIIKIVPKSEQDPSAANVTRAVVKPAIPGSAPAAKGGAKKRGADEAFGHDLDHWARQPSKSKIDGTGKPTSLQIQEAEEDKLFLEGLDSLPSKEMQEHLAEVFFENIYGQAYHILHKPSYMRKLRAGTLPPVLVLSVCAISARFSNHPKLSASPNFLRGEEWASHARDICMKRYEWPNITILTCLMLLGLHEFGTCHGGRSWALGGQAIRMAFALQLHRDLEYDPQRLAGRAQLSFIDREIRRRTMWACFMMDRFNSSGTDRPMFIREQTVKIPLPIKERYFQLDMPAPTETLKGDVLDPVSADDGQLADAKENMGVAAYMIKAIALWGRIISYLNQGGQELDDKPLWSAESGYTKLVKDAEDILDTLPESLKYSTDNVQLHNTENMANQFLFLHIAIQMNILFLNRVASNAGQNKQEVPKSFVNKAGVQTFAAANRISELLKDAESYFVAAPFAGYCAFSSSTIHIMGIFSGNPSMEATSKRNLATNVKFLSKMKRYWGMFHWMSENLREQYRTYADAARQGTQAKDKATTSPMFQYGDWFDRYPHGVSQADFVEPGMYKKKEKGDDAVLEQKPELHTVEEFFTTLSPQSSERGDGARAGGLKRKQLPKKLGGSLSRAEQQQLEPLMTDFQGRHGGEGLSARLQHHRSFSGALGGQTSGPTGFNPLTIPHSQTATSYHALSPISPATVGQFGHHHHSNSFYSPDLISMGISQGSNSIIQPLDRQLVFGAYAMDPGSMSAGANMLDGVEWDGLSRNGGSARSHSISEGTARRSHGRMGVNGESHGSGGHGGEGLGSYGQEASSAWFMPFNMEPPEIGQDMGLGVGNLDGLSNMFGGGGMTTPNGGGMGGGLRHGH